MHWTAQLLAVHFAVEFAMGEHTCEHEPQLPGSLVSSTQKPLQSEYPELHVNEHALLVQAGLAWATPVVQVEQAVPLPQAVTDWPATHVPAEQQPAEHAEPQPPQFL